MTLDPVPGRVGMAWAVFRTIPAVRRAIGGSDSRSRTLRHALQEAGVLVGGRVDVERAQEPFARWLATRRRIRPTVTAPRQQGQPGAARLARQAAVARHLAGVAGGPMLPPWVEP
jgi:hypothetical protein